MWTCAVNRCQIALWTMSEEVSGLLPSPLDFALTKPYSWKGMASRCWRHNSALLEHKKCSWIEMCVYWNCEVSFLIGKGMTPSIRKDSASKLWASRGQHVLLNLHQSFPAWISIVASLEMQVCKLKHWRLCFLLWCEARTSHSTMTRVLMVWDTFPTFGLSSPSSQFCKAT